MKEYKSILNLKEGHFYISPNVKDYFYYCEKIDNNIVEWILLESYQHGGLFQARFTVKPSFSVHYLEVKEQKEIMRLNNVLKEFYTMEKENEFNKMIEEIDNDFKRKDMPIFQRPIYAIGKVSRRLNTRLIINHRGLPIRGDYSGDSLVAHIREWYKKRYGDRLKIDLSPGSVAVLIKRDLWKIKFPLLFGKARFVFNPNLEKFKDEPKYKINESIIINPLNCIEKFTTEIAKSLSRKDMRELAQFFVFAFETIRRFSEIKTKPFVPEARSDLKTAVNNLFYSPPNYGQSKWASLQFTEKLFKCFLKLKKVNFPKKHNLEQLTHLAFQSGLKIIPLNIIKNIQCSAGVRYGEERVTLKEAVDAHHSSLRICAILAPAIEAV